MNEGAGGAAELSIIRTDGVLQLLTFQAKITLVQDVLNFIQHLQSFKVKRRGAIDKFQDCKLAW